LCGVFVIIRLLLDNDIVKQESSAVAGNYRAMRDTRTKSLYLIVGQRSEKEHENYINYNYNYNSYLYCAPYKLTEGA